MSDIKKDIMDTTPKFKDLGKTKYILLLAGITTVLPWNFFMSAYDYYQVKLTLEDPSVDKNHIYDTACDKLLLKFNNESCTCEDKTPLWMTANFNTETKNTDFSADLTKANELYKSTFIKDSTGGKTTTVKQNYTIFWNSFLSFVTMGTMVITSAFSNSDWLMKKFTSYERVTKPLIGELVCLIATVIQIYITGLGVPAFFTITMIIVLLINVCGGIFQTTMFQVCGVLPMSLFNMFIQGQAIGGVFANLLAYFGSIIVEKIFTDDKLRMNNVLATGFFLCGAVFVLLTYFGYIQMLGLESYKHFSSSKENSEDEKLPLAELETQTENLSATDLILKAKYHLAAIWLIFTVTLALFPTMVALVKSSFLYNYKDSCGLDTFSPKFFKLAVLLTFNLGDFLGRGLAGTKYKFGITDENSGIRVFIMSIIRVIFYILIFYCNITGNRRHGAFWSNDFIFIIIMILFGVTNGYISALAMQYAPTVVSNPAHKGRIGGICVVFLTLGLLTGAALSFVITATTTGTCNEQVKLVATQKLGDALKRCVDVCAAN